MNFLSEEQWVPYHLHVLAQLLRALPGRARGIPLHDATAIAVCVSCEDRRSGIPLASLCMQFPTLEVQEMMGYHAFGMFGGHAFGGIFMGIGLVVLFGLILWFVFGRHGCAVQTGSCATHAHGAHGATGPTGASVDAAEAIARERFARGEIGREEYDQIMATLRK